jgi:hypothetical protein
MEQQEKFLCSTSLGVSELRIVLRTVMPQETPFWTVRWMHPRLCCAIWPVPLKEGGQLYAPL